MYFVNTHYFVLLHFFSPLNKARVLNLVFILFYLSWNYIQLILLFILCIISGLNIWLQPIISYTNRNELQIYQSLIRHCWLRNFIKIVYIFCSTKTSFIICLSNFLISFFFPLFLLDLNLRSIICIKSVI